MKKILICGASSFVAHGFAEALNQEGYDVELFSRGSSPVRTGNQIRGKYLEIDKNECLAERYYAVVNFAVLKNASAEDNVKYLEALCRLCERTGISKLIHFSSIMVYDANLKRIDERSPIASSKTTDMKGYGVLKIATDEYLDSVKASVPFQLIRVRPGFVLAEGVACPFIKNLPGGFKVILGNKKSTLPIVWREDIHKALIKLLEEDVNIDICHLFPDNGMTKYQYAKDTVGGRILTLPKFLFKDMPHAMAAIKLMPNSLAVRFERMFIDSHYSSELSEKTLGFKFK